MKHLRSLRSTLSNWAAGGLLVLLLAACQGEPDNVWEPDDSGESLMTELRLPTSFDITPTAVDGGGSFALALGNAEGVDDQEVPLVITGGSVELWASSEDVLVIRDVDIRVAPVGVGASVLPPHGAILTDVSARLISPAVVEPNDDGARLSVIARIDLEASWAVQLGEEAYPLSTLRLRDVPFSLEVRRNELGELRAHLVAFRDGPFWSWADQFELSDLTVDLLAAR